MERKFIDQLAKKKEKNCVNGKKEFFVRRGQQNIENIHFFKITVYCIFSLQVHIFA